MKTRIVCIVAVILFFILFACVSKKEIIKNFKPGVTVEVTVNTYEEDTNYLHNRCINPFPMKTDNRWNLSFTRDTGKKIRCTAVRNFSSFVMLKKTFILNNSKWENLSHSVSFKKKFRWFYTTYCYNEVFYRVNPFDLPVGKFLTRDELQSWKNRNDALENFSYDKKTDSLNSIVNEKAENWLKECCKLQLVSDLNKAFEILQEPSLKPALIATNIDTILKLCQGEFNTKKIIAAMAGFYRNEKIYQLLDKKFYFIYRTEKTYKSIEDNFYEEAVFKTIMPGVLVEENAKKKMHDTLCWSVTAYKFFFNDYELKAQSRMINYWAFVVTGILLLLLTAWVVKKQILFKKI
jgi:hypothetical protein